MENYQPQELWFHCPKYVGLDQKPNDFCMKSASESLAVETKVVPERNGSPRYGFNRCFNKDLRGSSMTKRTLLLVNCHLFAG